MRPLWKGAISFGLVSIPVAMYSATARADLSFRLLHAKDGSPVSYKRFCAAENVEVPWPEIVKGYEYEKGQFVVLTDEDFKRASTEATERIDIRDFVAADEIDFVYFEQPYYLEPQKTGVKAYALLREALKRSGRIGVATFVLRQREHLAAVKVSGDTLVLTTMRFSDEIVPPAELSVPRGDTGLDQREINLALQLVDTLAGPWAPTKYRDEYRETLLKAIEQKVEGRAIATPAAGRRPAGKVVDLMQALEASLQSAPSGRRDGARAPGRRVASAKRPPARRRAS